MAVVFGTLFAPRRRDWKESGLDPTAAYDNAAEAEALGLEQLARYEELARDDAGGFRAIGDRADLEATLDGWADGATGPVGIVPLMEGADPIRRPGDAAEWFDRGVRIVGLAWRGTRYAGGTGEPGPLTDAGRALLGEMRSAGLTLDLSHAAEESFHEALDLFDGPVIASHSNPRELADSDRQLTDEMIRKLGVRGAVIGHVPFNRMLVTGWGEPDEPPVPMRRVADAIRHTIDVTGSHETAAIGSDFDGGFGRESAPEGFDTIADLPRLADVLSDLDFTDEQIYDILGLNWIRFLERTLPAD